MSWAQLAPATQRTQKPPIEETAWRPGPERARLLRQAMGDARYYQAWSKHRGEMKELCQRRDADKKEALEALLREDGLVDDAGAKDAVTEVTKEIDGNDVWHMPTSWSGAQQRAQLFARESACWTCPQVKVLHNAKEPPGPAAKTWRSARSRSTRRRSRPRSQSCRGSKVQEATATRIRLACHLCQRPIMAVGGSAGQSCVCCNELAAA